MITDAVLALLRAVLDLIVGLLPDDTLELPSGVSVSAWFGTYAGPADRFMPISEALTALELVFSIYLPIALTYTLVKWSYKHLPVFGKG